MKKSILILLSLAVLCVAVFLSACSKDDVQEPDPVAGLTKITEGYAAGAAAKVEVYSKETSITAGYTKFYIALYDSVSGNRIEDAHIQLTPMMDMGTMMHSSPYENPASEKAVNHLFPCSVTFIMSSMGGTWTLKIQVHNHFNDKEGTITIPITVNEPTKSRQKSFTAAHNGAKYFISLIEPTAASSKVGINDMEIAIYKKASMMSWPADSSLSVILTPEMPTMGHGSPNNVNPTHIGNGHYKGKVNFTMTGLWRLNIDFMSGAAVADTTQYFDVEF
jgi:hypothetical protein